MKKYKFNRILFIVFLSLSVKVWAAPIRMGIIVGQVDSFDLQNVTLDVKGILVRIPRNKFNKDLDLRPGKQLAIRLPVSEIMQDVVKKAK